MIGIYLFIVLVFVVYRTIGILRVKPCLRPTVDVGTVDGKGVPLVSFLVPAWNAARDIPEFVDSFERLTYSRLELVLCVGGMDGSFDIASRCSGPKITVIPQLAGEGKQRALERSYVLCKGEIIYLSDIDCRPDNDVVAGLLNPLLERRVEVATGSCRPLDRQLNNPFVMAQWSVQKANDARSFGEVRGLLGRNAALRREVVDATGGFRTPAPTGTDYTLAKEVLRRGFRIWCVPQSAMPTELPDNASIYIHKQARWIANVLRIGWRYRAYREVRSAAVTVMMPMGLTILVGLGFVWHLMWTLLTVLALQSLFNRMVYQRLSGMPVELTAIWRHFWADQLAALAAGVMVVRRQWVW